MPLAIRPHPVALRIDDDTWAELERTARARGESPADLVVYAVELFLEQRGFVPAWAQQPLDARLARPRVRRRP
ncbi:MAG: ribbon-helix-helix domain-containing protein [Alphaproteobacteria bacterium]|nr:ribbon-helix-helix domain-containing protein [Alphaproteobacteria bacterium]MBU1513273.1 ribbon-helix-helix domain-containing protein [Alphaproteobacteria bacterium]MBU2093607.1 ribbon-helix-helix domain-containing protein [Alphaproteobacteria bacterium]MBU2151949.1 ribbon-helix-helix domain-containing protein [Alphaproteobacteria bacterium]MBU2307609.1 ribbon-helix-helix domain-containing protein [Alphaproteobacteria bacterium]